ncbi:GNAT family N-acetyltransferase [Cellulomonas carbonis]|uniref:GCN5 family acetyltransferase n=1 Tax=Cellulomonas carbonis T26 TaxID=947969 RepID=A0A0A0BSB3_9CELL|nr:DUF4081 domain-containing GNAT family N-acetyltransferase [Cellulomonas carbonis]KGM11328.1 GCN5 family acetyltransferase [Cellulomonas carbonis T26]GGB97691.1 N-acetyltransferase GCN5 [Cellulomonas carbonis]
MGPWGVDVRGNGAAVNGVDLREALGVCDRDPVGSVLAASRIESALADGGDRAGSSLWGFRRDGRLDAVCWAGANLVPVCAEGDVEAVDAFARAALRQGRRSSSIVGPAWAVLALWDRLEPSWGTAREVRPDQPSLVLDGPPLVEPDPDVRAARPDEIGIVLPACVHMFVEEVGYSPVEGGSTAYESRVRALIAEQRSFVRVGTGERGPHVVFKAELGAVTRRVAQVQGVWVTPSLRGRGLAAPGMAAVTELARLRFAPSVSLYVNSYNERALATYRRVGFRQVGTYATVLF